MFDAFMWFIFIPVIFMAGKFWLGVLRWLRRNQKTLGQRVERVKSAFSEEP